MNFFSKSFLITSAMMLGAANIHASTAMDEGTPPKGTKRVISGDIKTGADLLQTMQSTSPSLQKRARIVTGDVLVAASILQTVTPTFSRASASPSTSTKRIIKGDVKQCADLLHSISFVPISSKRVITGDVYTGARLLSNFGSPSDFDANSLSNFATPSSSPTDDYTSDCPSDSQSISITPTRNSSVFTPFQEVEIWNLRHKERIKERDIAVMYGVEEKSISTLLQKLKTAKTR